MSLIDEALKRARQEAALQDAAAREARYARVPVYAPPSGRSRRWVIPAVVAACLAAGTGLGLFLSRGGSPSPPAASAPAPPAAPERIAQAAPPPVEPRPEAPREVAPPEETVPPRIEIVEEEPEPPAAPVALPPAAPVVAAAPPAPAPAREEPKAAAAEPPQTYVREVPLPGGGTLRLNGIAFSEQPVALFGDKVVSPGESVDGFTVVEIEAKRVKLEGQGGATVYVTLR